jgi:hypothetical protein
VVDVVIERHADEEAAVGCDIEALTLELRKIGGEEIPDADHLEAAF